MVDVALEALLYVHENTPSVLALFEEILNSRRD
jgi:hypothetical protein